MGGWLMAAITLREQVDAYLGGHSVLTLATAGPEGPWAAPVFFAADGLTLYFVSDPETRHGRAIGAGARVAGAITEDYRDWAAIQGLQVEGLCRPVEPAEQQAALAVFVGKYPFAALFLDPSGPMYEKAGSKVRFYRLVPDGLWLTDNTQGFGHREQLELE